MDLTKMADEQLIELKHEALYELKSRQFPNKAKCFKALNEYFKNSGFKKIEGKDARHLTNGKISVFNCPHLCHQIIFFKGEDSFSRERILFIPIKSYIHDDMTQNQVVEFIYKVKKETNKLLNKS